MPLLGFMLWGSYAKARYVNSDKSSHVFSQLREGFFKGVLKGKALGAGKTAYHKGHWGATPGTYIYL